MNIVTGSSGGLGRHIYDEFKISDLPVLGIDKIESTTTDYTVDLSENKYIKHLAKEINMKIDSITFAHAIGNSKKEIDTFSLSKYRFINADSNLSILEEFSNNLSKKTSVVFISSVHSIATNKQSGSYAVSKKYLESLYRYICLNDSKFKFNKCLLRIGAMNTNMLTNNIDDLDGLKLELPSKKIIEPKDLAKLIFDIHIKYSKLLDCSILQIDGGVLLKLGTN